MKVIVNARLPKKPSLLLNSLGVVTIHTLDLPERNQTGNDIIMKIAIDENRIVITKDSDFLQNHLLKNNPGVHSGFSHASLIDRPPSLKGSQRMKSDIPLQGIGANAKIWNAPIILQSYLCKHRQHWQPGFTTVIRRQP